MKIPSPSPSPRGRGNKFSFLSLRERTKVRVFIVKHVEQSLRRFSLRFFLFFLFILCSPLAPSSLTRAQSEPAWRQQWDKATAAAKKEGKVVVFGPAGELIRNALTGGFNKSFPGITLEYVGGRATEQATRMKAERDGGVFSVDVFIGGAATMMDLGSSGVLEPLEPVLILPEVKELVKLIDVVNADLLGIVNDRWVRLA